MNLADENDNGVKKNGKGRRKKSVSTNRPGKPRKLSGNDNRKLDRTDSDLFDPNWD
jgi:hypothetical protein